MRVTLDLQEHKVGLFSKTIYYKVICDIVFSDEEKQIIKRAHLEDQLILKRDPPATIEHPDPNEDYNLYMKHLLKPNNAYFKTPLDAKVYQQHLTDKLKELKVFLQSNIEASQHIAQQNKMTFEGIRAKLCQYDEDRKSTR